MGNVTQNFLNFLSLLSLVRKRLFYHAGLSFSSLLGIVGILSLVICVPVFAGGILSKVLEEQLTERAVKNQRSLFSLHLYYPDNDEYTNLSAAGGQRVGQYIRQQLQDEMGLKVNSLEMQETSIQFAWKPVKYQSSQPPFKVIYMAFMSSDLLADKLQLVEGKWPETGDASSRLVQAALLEDYADKNFLNVGDVYQVSEIYQAENLQIEIVGIFRPIDAADPAWFYAPETTLRDALWVPMSFFEQRLPALMKRPVHSISWYAIVDDSSLRFSQSLSYVRQMLRLENALKSMLPGGAIDYSPLEMLKAYESRLQTMIALFYAAGAPTLILALLFVWLTASIAVGQYEQETAILSARGGHKLDFLWLNLAESLALILAALPAALLIGWAAAALMGQTQLFLQFTRRSQFNFSLRDVQLPWLSLSILGIILARLLPQVGWGRASILSIKQERSRSLKKPLWERLSLDLMLFIPAYYAYWAMSARSRAAQSTAAVSTASTSLAGGAAQPAYDPLMFIASSLFALSLCLLALRIYPLLLRLLAAATAHLNQVWLYLAVQEIARRPREHASSLLLVMISLSFSIFSASMALTMEHWLSDAQYYRAGADLAVKEYAMPANGGGPGYNAASAEPPASGSTRAVEAIISLERHLQQPDIQSATYVGRWPGRFSYGASMQECQVMGIDRLTFPTTGFFRRDFADESLGALMNALASQTMAALIPQSLADETGLQPGDTLRVEAAIGVAGEVVVGNLTVVGIYRYFPTVYAGKTPTLITSLDTLFGAPDAVTGVDVWLKLRPGAPASGVLDDLESQARRDFILVDVLGNALDGIRTGMEQPEWVGLFGVLNVGFLLTGLLPALGFVLYSFASLSKRATQFGILQALGLSARQTQASLALEQVLLMSMALLGGAGVGFATCQMFLPFLQVGLAGAAATPPFAVWIGWQQAAWLCLGFGAVFLLTLAFMLFSMAHLQITQALKLGEEV